MAGEPGAQPRAWQSIRTDSSVAPATLLKLAYIILKPATRSQFQSVRQPATPSLQDLQLQSVRQPATPSLQDLQC
jgi:hypothetical protein